MSDFYKNMMKDWGKDDVYGPWTILTDDNKLHFYKEYYLVTVGCDEAKIDLLGEIEL